MYEEYSEPLMEMNEDKQFMSIVRWLEQTNKDEEISLRLRAGLSTYGISIKKDKRIKVNCLYLESNEEAFVMYEWQADETGENLTKERILDAMKNADKRNQEREDFFNSLLTPEINITKELYEMVEDFLHEETKPIDYLHDEIKLTEQDRQVAAQILEDIF